MSLSIEVRGLEPYRVYQRDSSDHASISFEVALSEFVSGFMDVRVVDHENAVQWTALCSIDGLSASCVLSGLVCGQYGVELRIMDHEQHTIAEAEIAPVFVGDLWVLAGQSNMEGFGALIDTESPQAGINCFYMGDQWGPAVEPLHWCNESLDPVHWSVTAAERQTAIEVSRRDRTKGAGLGLAFAKEVFRQTGIPIGLIPCAVGGSNMIQWDPDKRDQVGSSLYGAMLRRVEAVGGHVKGFLWYQGESEASPDAAPRYLERMKHFVTCVRRDLDMDNLPFIYAQLSRWLVLDFATRWFVYVLTPESCWWDQIREAQYTLESEIPFSAMVPTIDGAMTDLAHLDASSLSRVGQRMAWQALRLGYALSEVTGGPRPKDYYWNDSRTKLELRCGGLNGRFMAVERAYALEVEVNGSAVGHTATLSSDGLAVVLAFEAPMPKGARLWHGRGFNPIVNLRDAYGIPLPAFGPIVLD